MSNKSEFRIFEPKWNLKKLHFSKKFNILNIFEIKNQNKNCSQNLLLKISNCMLNIVDLKIDVNFKLRMDKSVPNIENYKQNFNFLTEIYEVMKRFEFKF